MFDKEFFPTPVEVLESMGVDCIGKICYEPHAGKGDIVDYLQANGASSVIASELNDDLRVIAANKCEIIGSNVFNITADMISHIQLIVMNPPFSNADKHIEHIYSIMPEGCEMVSLCNYETISKSYRYTSLSKLIENYGSSSSLGSCFDIAERKTNIEVGLIKLYKPVISESSDFNGFFFDEDEEDISSGEGVVQFNEVRALVQRYVGSMRVFDEIKASLDKLEYTTSALGMGKFSVNVGYNENVTDKESFSKHLQKVSWNHIIDITGIRKFTTSLMMTDINKFVNLQHNIPFTMKNVYRMLDMIVQTRQQQFDKALIASVDEFTEHIKENRLGIEGWATNKGHMINRKIIIPNLFKRGWNNADYVEVNHSARYTSRVDDLMKVTCSLIGFDYKELNGYRIDEKGVKHYNREGIYSLKINDCSRLETGKWYDWGFMEFKCFYKGTMHLRFKNKDDWYTLNKHYGELKGFVLPEKM